jgi:hypothetical protein
MLLAGADRPHGPARRPGSPGDSPAFRVLGVPSGTCEFAEFYALMPPDKASTAAVGSPVSFPEDGPRSGSITGSTQPASASLVIQKLG